jgi:polygalacturonase
VCPRYLKATGQSETLPDFKAKMDGVLLDEAVIKAAIQQDKAKESQQRASAQRSKA